MRATSLCGNITYETSRIPFRSNTNCTSLKLDGNLWPESRMTLPLGSSLLASILRKCRGHRVQTRMGRSRISIVDGVQEREVHGYGVRRGQVMTLGVTVTRRSPCSANTYVSNESGTATVQSYLRQRKRSSMEQAFFFV